MLTAATEIQREPRRILALSLVFAFLFATGVCGAMASAPTHPCCPKPAQSGPDRCEKAGCISTVPVLPPESISSTTELPVAAAFDDFHLLRESQAEPNVIPALSAPEFELFLRHHQLLI